MAARLPTPGYCIQHSRFTKQSGWRLRDLSLSLNGNIAVTGYNENTRRTYIDVYTNVGLSDCRDKPKIIYSKELEKYEDEETEFGGRLVSFIDSFDDNRGLVIASCLGDKIELIKLNQDQITKCRKVRLVNHGRIKCLSVRDKREIFVGFHQSNKITVYDVIGLNEIKSIILQGIQDGYYPFDMTAIADRIFVCVGEDKEGKDHKSLVFEEKSGRILSELTKPTDIAKWYVEGLALNITLNVIAVAWSQTFVGTRKGKDVIVFYSLLSENNCSFLIVEVEFGVDRIRISDGGDRMITGDRVAQEWKVYDMSEFFRYDHLKENLQSQLQEDDCLKLTDFFAFTEDQRDEIFKSDTRIENLFLALEEKGIIQPYDMDRLAEALTKLGIKSASSYLVEFYQKTRTSLFYKETTQKLQEQIKAKQKVEYEKTRLETENKTQVQNLQQELQRINQEHMETKQLLQQTEDFLQQTALVKNKFKAECDHYKSELSILGENFESVKQDLLQTKQLLKKVTEEKNPVRADLDQSQLQLSMRSMSFEGNLSGDKLAGAAQHFSPDIRRRSDSSVPLSTARVIQESHIEREFSMLLVKVSVKLTNDNCVVLATYFNLPESKIDHIRKDSGTAGITLLGAMKERNLVNMYNVSNLRQALDDIELCEINETLVKPYQQKIDFLMNK